MINNFFQNIFSIDCTIIPQLTYCFNISVRYCDLIINEIFLFFSRKSSLLLDLSLETSNFTKFTLITQLIFSLLLLFISLICLLFFAFQRSIVNSLLYLILFLASLFFSLFFLGIDYISLLFLIVYIGAIIVLFLFVIFMSNLQKIEARVQYGFLFWLSIFFSMLLFFLFATIYYDAYSGTLVKNAYYYQFMKDFHKNPQDVLPSQIFQLFLNESNKLNFSEPLFPYEKYTLEFYAKQSSTAWNTSLAYYHADIYLIGFLLYTKYYVFFLLLGYLLFVSLIIIVMIVYNLPIQELANYKFKYERNIKFFSSIDDNDKQKIVAFVISSLFLFLFYVLLEIYFNPVFTFFYDFFPISLFFLAHLFDSTFLLNSSYPQKDIGQEISMSTDKIDELKNQKSKYSEFYFYYCFLFYFLIILITQLYFLGTFLNSKKQNFDDLKKKTKNLLDFFIIWLKKVYLFLDYLLLGYSEEILLQWRSLISYFLKYNVYLFFAFVNIILFAINLFRFFYTGYKTHYFFIYLITVRALLEWFVTIGLGVVVLYLIRVLLYVLFVNRDYTRVFSLFFLINSFCYYCIAALIQVFAVYFFLFLGLFLYGLQFEYSAFDFFFGYLSKQHEFIVLNFLFMETIYTFLLCPLLFLFVYLIYFFVIKVRLIVLEERYKKNEINSLQYEEEFSEIHHGISIAPIIFNLVLFIELIFVYQAVIDHYSLSAAALISDIQGEPIHQPLRRLSEGIYVTIIELVATDIWDSCNDMKVFFFERALFERQCNEFLDLPWKFDILSVLLVGLTIMIFSICFIYNTISYKISELNSTFFQIILYFVLEIILIYFFLTDNLLIFYVLFELSLLPTFLLIWFFGKRSRRFLAGYSFIIYTGTGAVLFLFLISYAYVTYGTLEISVLRFILSSIPFELQCYGWWVAFLAFAVKIPLVPFHSWLPETHVEAPTSVSIILASLLLKLGLYGLIRILIPFFPVATIYFTPFILALSLISLLYSTIISFYQVDIKKIIAYSSVAHMSGAVLSLFLGTTLSILSFMIMIFSHAFISSALFLLVGCLYDRYGSRLIKDFGGIARIMPRFSFLCFFFFFANVGVPGTPNFWSEFYMISSLFVISSDSLFSLVLKIIIVVLFITAAYSLVTMVKILFGEVKNIKTLFLDLNFYESISLWFFVIFSLITGLYPTVYYSLFVFSIEELKYFFSIGKANLVK